MREDLVDSATDIFYITSIVALALSLLVLCVSTMGIVFAQRLGVQATAEQGSAHHKKMEERNFAFVSVLIALALSMLFVVSAALAMVWAKDPSGEGDYGSLHTNNWVAITSTVFVLIICILSCIFMYRLYSRLHTHAPADSNLVLGPQGTQGPLGHISEFYVGGNESASDSGKTSKAQSPRCGSPRRTGSGPTKSTSFGSLIIRQTPQVQAAARPGESAPLVAKPAPLQGRASLFSSMGGV